VQEIVERNKDIAIEITKMNEKNNAFIRTGSRGLRARLLLVDLYLVNEKAYTPQVEALVREINEAIAERHRYNWR
jgi:hypothetical protein